jgi:hypothetical protein
MRYRADITAGSLKVPESRVIADLLIRGVDGADWDKAVLDQNVLQARSVMMDAAIVPTEKVYAAISTSAKWRKIQVIKRHTTDPKAIQAARALGKEVFARMGPDGEDALFDFLTGRLGDWRSSLTSYKSLAETEQYPGREEITEGLTLISALLAATDSVKFIERFNGRKNDLLDLCDNYHDLEHFYEHQKPTWDKLRKSHDRFRLNKMELEQDDRAAPALRRMQEILNAKAPYGMIKDAEGLIRTVEEVNITLLSARRAEALNCIERLRSEVLQEVARATSTADPNADEQIKEKKSGYVNQALQDACLDPLAALQRAVEQQESIAHIGQAAQQAELALDDALLRIDEFLKKQQERQKPDDPVVVAIKPRKEIKPSSLVKTTYLESRDDVDRFLDALRRELEDALARGQRIQIR